MLRKEKLTTSALPGRYDRPPASPIGVSTPSVSDANKAFEILLANGDLREPLASRVLNVVINFLIRDLSPLDDCSDRCADSLTCFEFSAEPHSSGRFNTLKPDQQALVKFGGVAVSGGAVVAISMPLLFSPRSLFFFPDGSGAVGAELNTDGSLDPRSGGFVLAKDDISCHVIFLADTIPKKYRQSFEVLNSKHIESIRSVLSKNRVYS